MVQEIRIERIEYGTNVRTEKNDILQPLVVRPVHDHYECICGHRRLRALQKMGGVVTVPCIVRNDIDDKDILRIQIEENIQRKQMSAEELVAVFDKLKAQGKKTNAQKKRKAIQEKNTVKNISKVTSESLLAYIVNINPCESCKFRGGMIVELIILSAFLVFLLVLLFVPHKCPNCGGKIKDVVLSKKSVVCRCDNCGNFGYKE